MQGNIDWIFLQLLLGKRLSIDTVLNLLKAYTVSTEALLDVLKLRNQGGVKFKHY